MNQTEPCMFSCGGFALANDGTGCTRDCLPSRGHVICGEAFAQTSGFSEGPAKFFAQIQIRQMAKNLSIANLKKAA